MTRSIRLGTRGSPLALAQAHLVRQALSLAAPQQHCEIVVIRTSGDKDRVRSLVAMGGQGVFVKELENALVDGSIDLAVHSLKDMPSALEPSLLLGGFLPRENPRDALVTAQGLSWEQLPTGARVGTGSPRRVMQLRDLRPDLRCTDLRGNLESRLQKVWSGELDAILLGCAGLNRLNLSQHIGYTFPPAEMVPAVAQGIVALQIRSNDPEMQTLCAQITDARAALAAKVERAVMAALGGGCRVPMAALCDVLSEHQCHLHLYLGDPVKGTGFRASLGIPAQAADRGEWHSWLESVMQDCRARGIPLPCDLPGHALMEFWGHPEKLP